MKKKIFIGILFSVMSFGKEKIFEGKIGSNIYNINSHNEIEKNEIEISGEYRKNTIMNFELGSGISYKTNFLNQILKKHEVSKKNETLILYEVGQYNINFSKKIKLYAKGKIGYEIHTESGIKEIFNQNYKIDARLYYGIGVGLEYKSFLIDLFYNVSNPTIKEISDLFPKIKVFDKDLISKNAKLTLSTGYIFRFKK